MYFSQFEARIIFHVVLDSFYFLLSAHSLSLHLFYFQHVQLHIFVLSIQTIQTKILRYTAQNESQNSICRKSDLRFIKKTKRNTHKSKINHVNLLHLQQSAAVCRLEKKKTETEMKFLIRFGSFYNVPNKCNLYRKMLMRNKQWESFRFVSQFVAKMVYVSKILFIFFLIFSLFSLGLSFALNAILFRISLNM